jgi:lipopolysaccharide export system permease protein
MFILIMQFFWMYIDDLMGKGISVAVIIELLFYISASLIPLALPLTILLSSIMTLGNLSENNELTALKSSGLSLYRILRPLTGVILVIALATFLFANYVIPVSTLKWHSLIYDIQNTKISSIIKPGSYSTDLDGFAIKVDEGNDDSFKGILIHDHTTPNEIKSIRAKKGRIYKSENGKHLFFELQDGTVMEELAPQAPNFSDDGISHSKNSNHPSRRSSFKQATYKIDLQGFDLSRSNEDLFNDKHEMLNVFQIQYTIDSIQKSGDAIIDNFLKSIKNNHPYLNAYSFLENTELNKDENIKEFNLIDTIVSYQNLSAKEKISVISMAQTKLRNQNKNLDSQKNFIAAMDRDIDQYLIEFHRKFALTFAIVILFFVGAPLGAIVRKGGFGAPVVIAALLFMIYFVLITVGDNMAKTNAVSPFVGMWFASLVLLPIAFWLTRVAANDAAIFSLPSFKNPFKRN